MLKTFAIFILRLRCSRRRFNLVRIFLDLFSGHQGLNTSFSAAEAGCSINFPVKGLSSLGFHYLKK